MVQNTVKLIFIQDGLLMGLQYLQHELVKEDPTVRKELTKEFTHLL